MIRHLLLAATAAASIATHAGAQWSNERLWYQRSFPAAVGIDHWMFVAGGEDPYQDSIEVFDTRTRNHTVLNLTVPRSRLAAAAWGDYVLFAGGEVSLALNPHRVSGRVDVFDLTTMALAFHLEMPIPVKYVGGAAIDGKAFFAGGSQGVPSTGSFVQILDLTTFTWSTYALPGPARAWISVQTDARWLCLVGGGGLGPANWIDVYDSLTSTWHHTNTPTTSENSGAVLNGRLYVVSCDPGPQEQLMMILDLESMTWSTVPRQGGRCIPYAGAIDPFVIFASGRDQSSPWFMDTTDIYNTWTREWRTAPGGGNIRAAATAVVPDTGEFWIAGGQRSPASSHGSKAAVILTLGSQLGTTYCPAASPNSTGVPARMRAAGMTSVGENYLTLAALDAPPGQLGLFLVGTQPSVVAGGAAGNLCVGSPIGRLAQHVRTVDADGVLAATIDLNVLPLSPTRPAMPGETLYFQAVLRDSPPGMPLHFSDALQVTMTQ